MFRILSTLLLAAVAWLPPAPAHAQSCGDTITHDVTLTADLHCTTGWFALYVPSHGVTIDLNGHTISGDRDLVGISINDAVSVRIVNGGISGFWGGVVGLRAHKLDMQNMHLKDLGVGVSLNHSIGAQIIDNDFALISGNAISFAVPVGAGYGPAGSHYIGYNRIEESGGGVELCGYDNSDAIIVGNELHKIVDYGIHATDGSGGHRIEDNLFTGIENAGIVLRGSRDNEISGNVMRDGRLGIALTPQFRGSCETGPLASPLVRDNRIESNSLLKLDAGVSLGLGATTSPLVFKNRIGFNKIHDNTTGLYFREDAHDNDATGNAFTGTATPVVDDGAGNSY
jgi:parallel beta-helix repeat protein